MSNKKFNSLKRFSEHSVATATTILQQWECEKESAETTTEWWKVFFGFIIEDYFLIVLVKIPCVDLGTKFINWFLFFFLGNFGFISLFSSEISFLLWTRFHFFFFMFYDNRANWWTIYHHFICISKITTRQAKTETTQLRFVLSACAIIVIFKCTKRNKIVRKKENIEVRSST